MTDTEEKSDQAEEEAQPKKKKGKKRLLILILAPILLILIIVAVLFFLGVGPFGSSDEENNENSEEQSEVQQVEPPPTFFDLPEMRVNLNTDSNSLTYLKVKISLELASDLPEIMEENNIKLESLMPRVVDNMQVYMRELRLEDINGSAGLYRLKQELLSRVNRAVQPIVVRDILFSEFVIE
tara:strand:- start:131 stop:676 length:546 start_codon:yes stop_codon:yes gene_type:complete